MSDKDAFLTTSTDLTIGSLQDANQCFERVPALMGELSEKLAMRRAETGPWG
jgi:hypothetical protein